MIPCQRESSKAGIYLQVVSRETMPSGTKFSYLRSTWNIKLVVLTSLHVTEETRRGRAKVGGRHLMNKGSKEEFREKTVPRETGLAQHSMGSTWEHVSLSSISVQRGMHCFFIPRPELYCSTWNSFDILSEIKCITAGPSVIEQKESDSKIAMARAAACSS